MSIWLLVPVIIVCSFCALVVCRALVILLWAFFYDDGPRYREPDA